MFRHSITEFSAPQANTALDQPYAVELLAAMAELNMGTRSVLGENPGLFESIGLHSPYSVELRVTHAGKYMLGANLSIKGRNGQHDVPISMYELEPQIDRYIRAMECRAMKAKDALYSYASTPEENESQAAGGYALMMALRQHGLSVDPDICSRLFGVLAMVREQLLDRYYSQEAVAGRIPGRA